MRRVFRNLRTNTKGFTMVELLVVMSIIAVLAAVVMPAVTGMKTGGETASAKSDAKELDNAVNAFNTNSRTQTYPEASIPCVDSTDSYIMTIINSAIPGDPSKTISVAKNSEVDAQIPVDIAATIGLVCASGKVTSHTQLDFDAKTLVRQTDGTVINKYLIPDYLTSMPKSATWVRGSDHATSPDEFIWLLKLGTAGDGQGRTLQVLRLNQGSDTTLSYEIARN